MKTRKSFEQLIVTLLLAVLVLLPTSGFLLFSDTISGIVHQPQLLLLSKRRSCKPYGNSSHPRSSPLIKILKPIRSKLAESFCASTQGISKFEITPELVRKAAELSQIQVTDEEVSLLVPRMEEFIGFVETMEEVAGSSPIDDTYGRSDTFGATFLREDTVNTFCNVEAVMENMPLEEGNYLRVPRVGQDDE